MNNADLQKTSDLLGHLQKILEEIDPYKLRALAAWIDRYYSDYEDHSMQIDLRHWASLIEDALKEF